MKCLVVEWWKEAREAGGGTVLLIKQVPHHRGVVGTKRNASLFSGFFVDFSVISRPGGYPLENVSPCKLWREHKNYFCMFLRRPRGGFGTPLEPFWLPWACLGATLGATLAPKVNIKGRKKTLLVHVRAGSNFKYEKAGARTLIMWLNHSKY